MVNQNFSDPTPLHAGYLSIAEIFIKAAPIAIWPYVLDLGSWVYDFHYEHISGPRGGEGEVQYLWSIDAEGLPGIAVADRRQDNAIILKTVTAIPGKLWFGSNPQRLEGDSRSNGVNLVLLTERDGGTSVSTMRGKESLCQREQAAAAAQARMIQYQPVAQSRWTDKYLPRLKALCER